MQQTNFLFTSQSVQKKSNSWTLILLCLVFVTPFILGSLLYFFRNAVHFNSNAKGEILAPRLAKEMLNIPIDNFLGKWQLLYFSSTPCDADCQQRTELLQNVCVALGKDEPRVVLRTIPFSEVGSEIGLLPFTYGSVIIIDPKGWLVTHYHPSHSHFHAKGILDDLRRLMRYSYVG